MRNIFSLVIFIIYTLAFVAPIKASDPESDTCRPNFSDIYNFEIGDIFEFHQINSTSAGGTNPTVEKVTQYTIIDKYKTDSTYTYNISGWSETFSYTNNYINNSEPDTNNTLELFDTTLFFTDSANHILNACPHIVLPLYDQSINEFGFGDIYTMVQLDKNDSIFTKTIGGKENIFNYKDDSLKVVSEISYKAVYQSGMGLISMKLSFFEKKESITLNGFFNGSDTTGTLSPTRNPNQEITDIPTKLITPKVKKNLFYPNPAKGQIILNTPEELLNVSVFSLSATKVIDINHPSEIIDISALTAGIYTVRAISSEQHQTYISQLVVY